MCENVNEIVESYLVKPPSDIINFIKIESIKYNFLTKLESCVTWLFYCSLTPLVICLIYYLISYIKEQPDIIFFSSTFFFGLLTLVIFFFISMIVLIEVEDKEANRLIKTNFPMYYKSYPTYKLLDEISITDLMTTEISMDEYKVVKNLYEINDLFSKKYKEIIDYRNGIFTYFDYRVLNCRKLLSMAEEEVKREQVKAEIETFKKEIK
jgi:hypothetical protein